MSIVKRNRKYDDIKGIFYEACETIGLIDNNKRSVFFFNDGRIGCYPYFIDVCDFKNEQNNENEIYGDKKNTNGFTYHKNVNQISNNKNINQLNVTYSIDDENNPNFNTNYQNNVKIIIENNFKSI